MFKIGEFSKLTQVTVRMLRYYDEMGLLKPAVTDSWTGYRMYSVEQIPTLNKIRYLRDSGFQVAEIAQALQSHTQVKLSELLDKKYGEITKTIQSEQEQLRKLQLAKEELLTGRNEMHYQVSIQAIPAYQVLTLRKVIPNYYAEAELWNEISTFAKQRKIQVSGTPFSIYYDDDYREKDVDVELCVPVKTTGKAYAPFTFRQTESVPAMACTMVYGEFHNIGGAYLAFAKWLQEKSQYKMRGPDRQIVHRGPWNEEDPEKYLTEIQIPIEEY